MSNQTPVERMLRDMAMVYNHLLAVGEQPTQAIMSWCEQQLISPIGVGERDYTTMLLVRLHTAGFVRLWKSGGPRYEAVVLQDLTYPDITPAYEIDGDPSKVEGG